MAALLLLGACGVASYGDDPKFRGGVASDEPRAAVLARDVLERGGSAADAAVALYFGLAVLRPSVASLGAGGVCLAYDPAQKKVQTIDFVSPPSRDMGGRDQGTPGMAALPGAVRGLYAVHGFFGRQRWEQLLGPAEQLARFGAPVSRGLAADLAAGPPAADDEDVRAVFGRPDGSPVREGDEIRQPDLATVLGAIRMHGPAALHGGALGRTFAEAATADGGALAAEELAAAAPRLQDAIVIRSGYRRVHFAPDPATLGPYQALLFATLQDWRAYGRAEPEERPALLARAAAASYAAVRQAGGAVPTPAAVVAGLEGGPAAPPARDGAPYRSGDADRAGTGFVVVDTRGGTVACGLTMGRPFGTGRIAAGTGIFPAAQMPREDRSPALSPILVMNPNTNISIFAAAGAGTGAPTALAQLAAWAMENGEKLDDALAAPRVEPLRDEGILAEQAAVPALQAGGIAARPVAAMGLLNAAFCPNGMPRDPDGCMIEADRRGFGLDLSLGR